jgi:hypothetical protein
MKFKLIAMLAVLFASFVLATPLAIAQQEKKAPKSPHEDFIRAYKLETKQVEQVLDTYKKAVKAICPGAWHDFNDIRSMTGLEGRFLWTEDPLAPAVISFKFDPNGDYSFGTYTLARAGVTVEKGNFYSVPNNPLIGYAVIGLTPQGGSARVYVVEGMRTDDDIISTSFVLRSWAPRDRGRRSSAGCGCLERRQDLALGTAKNKLINSANA